MEVPTWKMSSTFSTSIPINLAPTANTPGSAVAAISNWAFLNLQQSNYNQTITVKQLHSNNYTHTITIKQLHSNNKDQTITLKQLHSNNYNHTITIKQLHSNNKDQTITLK